MLGLKAHKHLQLQAAPTRTAVPCALGQPIGYPSATPPRQCLNRMQKSSASSTVCRGAALAMPPIAPAAAAAPSPAFFEDLLSDCRTPLLVDFYATWCGPCQLMAGVLSDLQPSLHDIRIVKIDIDKHPQLATKYRVQGLPTLLLFCQGQPVDRVEGMMDRKSLGKRLRFYLLGLENKLGRR